MRRVSEWTFYILTWIIVLVYLLSCCTAFISPVFFWPMTFLALAFPITTSAFLLFITTWGFIKKKIAVLLFFVLLLGYSNITSTIAINRPKDFDLKKNSSSFRLLSWNVRHFSNNARHAESPSSIRRQMINYIKQVNADVLLFQEFTEYNSPAIYSNINVLQDSMGYKYCYVGGDDVQYPSWGKTESGGAIFSRYPITDTGRINFAGLITPESLLYADIDFGGRKVRFLTAHLVSINLAKAQIYREDKKIDSAFIYHSSTFTKLKHFDSLHSEQAEIISDAISRSNYPVIFSGDLNSVPSSYVYHTINGDLQDAFLEKGFGLGRTYYTVSPTLRIDYMFADRKLKIKQFTCPPVYLSDHFPLITDLGF